MSKWSGLDRGPITAAIAEAEQDRLFDRPARPLSRKLARLLASVSHDGEQARRLNHVDLQRLGRGNRG